MLGTINMDTVFKKGDRVFDYRYGWGKIVHMDFTEFAIGVQFDVRGTQSGLSTYTKDGRWNRISSPTLSFTEYTLEGFSQERPEELPNKGDVVWVKDFHDEEWQISFFVRKEGGFYVCTRYNPESEYYLQVWDQLTTKKPYTNESSI